MLKPTKVAFLEPFPTPASPIAVKDQGFTKSTAGTNILNLLSNFASKNHFMYKPADNRISALKSPKNVRRLSLQLHQNYGQDETDSKSGNNHPEKFVPTNFASFFNSNSPYTDRDDASRVNSSFFMDKSDCTSTTKNRFLEPKKLNHHVRRKSCYCTCCGGLSRLERKTHHLNLKADRVAKMDDMLSPTRQVSYQNPFSPPSRETTKNSNRSGHRGKRSTIDLRSTSPVKPKTAYGRRESMVARPNSPDFNLDSIQTRTRNKTYTYDRKTLIPGVIEESNLCAHEKSMDLSTDMILDISPKKNDESPKKKPSSLQKIDRNPAKARKERGSIDSNLESSPKPETKKTRVKLTKIKNGTKKSEKPADKAAKIMRSNSQLLLLQDYLGNLPKGSIQALTEKREASQVKRIVHQNSSPRFSLADLGASPRTEAANKEIEQLKSSGDLHVVEKSAYDSLMDLSLRKVPKPTPEKEEPKQEEEQIIQKESPKNRTTTTKKRSVSLPKLLFRPMGSKKKLQEVSKVYQSSREENDKRYGSVKIRLERIKYSSDKTMLLPTELTERSPVIVQRENLETRIVGVDSAYQRILKSLRSSLIEVSQEEKMHLQKRKSSAKQRPGLERTQSVGYFPVHLFTKRKNVGSQL